MKLRSVLILLTVLLVAHIAGLHAQTAAPRASDRHEIRLRSRIFTPSPSSAAVLAAPSAGQHLLIQFGDALTPADLERLSGRGMRVAGFVPNNAVVAYVPPGTDVASLDNVRWIGGLRAEDKVSSRIDTEGPSIHTVVFLHRGTDVDEARGLISAAGGEVINDLRFPPTTVFVRADGPTLRSIAALDPVSFIHLAPQSIVQGASFHVCPGPLTSFGYLPEFVTQGEGWDGPGLGKAILTYFFENGTPDVSGEQAEVLAAFDLWTQYADLSFSAAPSSKLPRSFDIKWASGSHGDGVNNAFDGVNGVLAHCFYPAPPNSETIAGDMHFDEAETWRIGSDIDVFSVALHEIGHGLGLQHSEDTTAVMAPFYTEPIADLRADDISGIRSLYASVTTARTATPIFDPASGSYTSPLEVRLQYGAGSNSGNTRITYTLNGSEPTPYSFEFVPGTDYIFQRYSNTIRARAFRQGQLPSTVVSASYELTPATPTVATPVITPSGGSYVGSVQVSISVSTDFALIRITQDGSEPTETSQVYGGAFPVASSQTVKAKAFLTGYSPSQTASATFTVAQQAAVPTIYPPSGVFQDPVTVYISANSPGATLRYTTDGSTPTEASVQYTSPFQVAASTTVKAAAFIPGGVPSDVATATYTLATTVATPSITPNGGSHTGSVQVSLATATPGATIRYTTNSADPTAFSTAYSGPFTLGVGTHTVKVRAFLEGASPSDVAAAQFQVYVDPTSQVETPTMTPFNGQQFVGPFTITMDCRTEGATIRWTQGTGIVPPDPTESGPGGLTYTGPFEWNAGPNTYFFKVKAFKAGLAASQTIQSGGLTVSTPAGTVETPTITPNGGTYPNPVQVTLATTTQFAQLAYTDDGTEPSTVLPIQLPTRTYNAPFTLSSSRTIKAKGYRTLFLESATATADFVFQCAMPAFAQESGPYVDTVVVELSTETSGGNTTIRYTLDGSDPTESSTAYSGPFGLGLGSYSVRARVFRFNFLPSEISSAEYVVNAQAVAPAITQQPQSQSVAEGTTATFEVEASGTPAPRYQWQRNGVDLPGETATSLVLENAQLGDAGDYAVVVTNSAGSVTSNSVTLTVTPTTDVREMSGQPIPTAYALHANYPNPFNPSTVIRYAIPQTGQVRLEIYNAAGQRVRTLVDAAQAPGHYEATWDGRNEAGYTVASGIYVYRLAAQGFSQTRKMVLVK